jgi:hypothetical protein
MIDYAASRYEDESIARFKDLYIRIAQAMLNHNEQEDITIGKLKAGLSDRKRIFSRRVSGLFRRKA